MQRLQISIPGDISPYERVSRFEKPIVAALKSQKIRAIVCGGGSDLGKGRVIACVIDLDVSDIKAALPVIRKVLRGAKASIGTTFIAGQDSKKPMFKKSAAAASFTKKELRQRAKELLLQLPDLVRDQFFSSIIGLVNRQEMENTAKYLEIAAKYLRMRAEEAGDYVPPFLSGTGKVL